ESSRRPWAGAGCIIGLRRSSVDLERWPRPVHWPGTVWAPPLTYRRLTNATGAEPITVSAAIQRLIGLGLIAIQPGSRPRAHTYLLALPRQMAARVALLSRTRRRRGLAEKDVASKLGQVASGSLQSSTRRSAGRRPNVDIGPGLGIGRRPATSAAERA